MDEPRGVWYDVYFKQLIDLMDFAIRVGGDLN